MSLDGNKMKQWAYCHLFVSLLCVFVRGHCVALLSYVTGKEVLCVPDCEKGIGALNAHLPGAL